ncbi:MAG: GNAT family N-acetyltransferase [Acidimicrobiia bacterium]|nr:GNAT family N-acetyltransferase [Acidimicrobiia bacterium]
MPKRRLGVALLLPPPVDREVDALRRACDDGAAGRVPPHLTLVPPVNVREDALDDAVAVLRRAAAAARPFTVQLGRPATFLPDNPTLYLSVAGPGLDAVVALRDRVFSSPLERPLTWPFVPHVTLADEMPAERIAAAVEALAGYGATVTFKRVHLLEETKTAAGRVWRPSADAPFAAPAVVGRGGIELELTESQHLDPEAAGFAQRQWDTYRVEVLGPAATDKEPFAIAARRGGVVVGTADGWTHGGVAHLRNLIVAADQRGQGVGSKLLAAFESMAADRGCRRLSVRTYRAEPAYGFYRGRGWVDEASWDWTHGREFVQLRRDL